MEPTEKLATLQRGGQNHWGVMLAQGWKGELGGLSDKQGWDAVTAWIGQAERQGFDGLWAFDHFFPYNADDDALVLEAWALLSAAAQMTQAVVLGTLVSCAGYRPSVVTVKAAKSIQIMSGGRFCLGIGTGWDQREFERLGLSFPSYADRAKGLVDLLDRAHQEFSQGGPALLVGGAGVRWVLPSAARQANLMNWQLGLDGFIAKREALVGACASAERDPTLIRLTHAPNFQMFDSEREFRRWRESGVGGMSAGELENYIRERGAFYGTQERIVEIAREYLDAGCHGFIVFCNDAPDTEALNQLAAVRRAVEAP